ncbi:MAG TPA: 5'/3'-nucleotidase SurE [Firmicutes bacterium]|nr:5'/3'-nucleotidase SurE [Bacillota bacterium]
MLILVTNDDGLWSPGIAALAAALRPLGEVAIFAPDRERSAIGHAITMHHPLRVEEVPSFPVEGVKAHVVNGTPSDCVKLGAEAILPRLPDLVVSGINLGPNLGTDVVYSGTVSGALEGVILGMPAIAVSLATDTQAEDFTAASKIAALLVRRVQEHGLPPDTLLNVNVPGLPVEEIAGVKVTHLGRRRYRNVFDRRTDPRGKVYYWMAGEVLDLDQDPEADTAAINNNLISVTPLRYDLTHRAFLPELERWSLESWKNGQARMEGPRPYGYAESRVSPAGGGEGES